MKTLASLPDNLRNTDSLKRLIVAEQAGPRTVRCDCEFVQLTRTGLCERCLTGALQELNDGKRVPPRKKMEEPVARNDRPTETVLFVEGVKARGATRVKNLPNSA